MADSRDTHPQFVPLEIDHVDHKLMEIYLVDEHGQPMKGRPVLKVRLHKRSHTTKRWKLRWEPMPSQSDEHSSADSYESI
jgi:hypothetical protein